MDRRGTRDDGIQRAAVGLRWRRSRTGATAGRTGGTAGTRAGSCTSTRSRSGSGAGTRPRASSGSKTSKPERCSGTGTKTGTRGPAATSTAASVHAAFGDPIERVHDIDDFNERAEEW